MRLLVGRTAFDREFFEDCLWIAVAQLRSSVAARRALGKYVDRSVEPDRDCALVQELAGHRIDIGAATRRDDSYISFDQARDQTALTIAKIALTITFEHLCGGIACGALDLGVAVDEGQAKTLGQAAPDRRLSDPH